MTPLGRLAGQLGDALTDVVRDGSTPARVALVVEVDGELHARSWRPDAGLDEGTTCETFIAVLRSDVDHLAVAEALALVAGEHVRAARVNVEGGGDPLGGDPARAGGRTARGGHAAPCTGSSSRTSAETALQAARRKLAVAEADLEDSRVRVRAYFAGEVAAATPSSGGPRDASERRTAAAELSVDARRILLERSDCPDGRAGCLRGFCDRCKRKRA